LPAHAGTCGKDEPGKNVKAKSGLNRSILYQGWSEFRRQLEYKQGWLGGLVLTVPPHRTAPASGAPAALT
jgi:putative transposase